MASAEQPLTRRELHRAHGSSGGHRPARTGPRPALALPRVRRLTLRLSFEAVAAATAVAFLAGAVTGVAVDTTARQSRATEQQAQAQRERADRAATVRLTAAAAQYAAVREHQAVVAAHAALADAEAVLNSAPALVGDSTVDPLGEAVVRLSALVDSMAPAELPQVPSAVPGSDVLTVVDDDADAPATPTAPAASVQQPTDQATDQPSDQATAAAAAPSTTTPAPPATEVTGLRLGVIEARAGAEAVGLALVDVPADVLDLGTSGDLLAAAEEVAALAAQVTALSDAVAVELADAAEAAEARRAEAEAKRIAAEQAALQAALARMSSRIAATNAAPNGQIPLELLCRPRFANVLLRCDAAQALDQLNAAYRAAFGRNLAVSGGYRTFAEQEQARATKGDLAAQPGTSNHGRALAVDFSDFGGVGQFDDPDYLWMVQNGPQFGWVHPPGMGPGGSGPLEPWHWEYGNL